MSPRLNFVTLALINLVSALLFILVVDQPVFDDVYNGADIARYVSQGVNKVTLSQHINPAGPGSYVWVAVFASGVDSGNELLDYRLGVFFSWLILVIGILWLSMSFKNHRWLLMASLPILLLPHSVTATSLVLTEGPGLLFSTFGSIFWLRALTDQATSPRRLVFSVIGAVLLGLAIVCRQYYLALIPAMFFVSLIQYCKLEHNRRLHLAINGFSIFIASIPILLLLMVWGGVTSSGMRSGSSYNGIEAAVSVNIWRPVIVFFYLSVYSLPFTLSYWLTSVWFKSRRYAALALIGGFASAYFGSELLQDGPLKSACAVLDGYYYWADEAVLFVIGGVSFVNVILLTRAIKYRLRGNANITQNLYFSMLFAVFFLAFFVIENAGVGGDIQFYERYVLQASFFMGVVIHMAQPKNHCAQTPVHWFMAIVSNAMLWRFAI